MILEKIEYQDDRQEKGTGCFRVNIFICLEKRRPVDEFRRIYSIKNIQ